VQRIHVDCIVVDGHVLTAVVSLELLVLRVAIGTVVTCLVPLNGIEIEMLEVHRLPWSLL